MLRYFSLKEMHQLPPWISNMFSWVKALWTIEIFSKYFSWNPGFGTGVVKYDHRNYTNLYMIYTGRKSIIIYISSPWGCFQIVNILFRNWDIDQNMYPFQAWTTIKKVQDLSKQSFVHTSSQLSHYRRNDIVHVVKVKNANYDCQMNTIIL